MTDTPGWASPGSSEPPRDDVRPPAGPQPGSVGGTAADGAGPHDGGYGGAYGSIPGQGQGPDGGGRGAGGPGAPGPGWGPGAPYGAPGGWGPGGWAAPVSPKPGVVPLRPLGVGEVLDGAVTTVRRHWRTALGLSLGLAAVQQLVQALAGWWAYEHPGGLSDLLSLAIGLPLDLLLGVVAVGMLTLVVSKAVLGQNVTLREAWAAARPRMLALTGVTLLSGLIAAAPMVPGVTVIVVGLVQDAAPLLIGIGALLLLAGLPFTVWLGIRFSLAAPALVLERQGVTTSLRRSARLVRGAWWRLFGINLLTRVIITIAAGMISAPFAIAAVVISGGPAVGASGDPFSSTMPPLGLLVMAIAGTIVSTLTFPLAAAVNVLLYIDQRIRREALDIELARAAGLPEPQVTGWSGQYPVPGA